MGWVGEFSHALYEGSLLQLADIPCGEEIQTILGEAFYAYAFILDPFYSISRSEKSCTPLSLSHEHLDPLKKQFKVNLRLAPVETKKCLKKTLKANDLEWMRIITYREQ